MKKIWSVFMCVLLTACIGGRSQPSQFYTLTPTADQAISEKRTSVGINRVQVARYIDRPQMVTLTPDKSEASLSEVNRWIEPLSDLVARTLASDLSVLLPKALVQVRTAAFEPYSYVITLDVTRLDAVLGQKAFLDADWAVWDINGNLVAREQSNLTLPVGDGYDMMAETESQLVTMLAIQIAEKIKTLH